MLQQPSAVALTTGLCIMTVKLLAVTSTPVLHPRTLPAAGCCCCIQADMAEGMWVTDEFESEAYEMGNMESLWGMYLWDK